MLSRGRRNVGPSGRSSATALVIEPTPNLDEGIADMTTITEFPACAVIVTFRKKAGPRPDLPGAFGDEVASPVRSASPPGSAVRVARCATISTLRGDPDVVVPFPKVSGRRRRRRNLGHETPAP